ncbi:glycosyltransferase [Dactylosporangium aurantiacum]|uniref:Glycosyltransferase n=1 Tax=Dactylosporangium aurantiacum TaxID=35754 RepID=A0A9Q9IFI0_9ACTN|nr:glycosyltransferase [Dactylosporangium aurantiacum]MDG6100827.1 glycosyltransferase [Dactylosporangium aurantiacum]UWZ55112.1 glycosyltransferase [Dactylosporangium aurantiacum]
MKVAMLVKTDDGGRWTLPHLDELRGRGHDVVAVLPPGSEGRLRKALHDRGIDVVQSAFDFRFRPSPATAAGLLGLRRQLRALAPDVLHYHLYASALATRIASLRLPARRVHMVAGPLYLESPLIRLVERLLCRLDTVVVGGSEHTAARYRRIGMPAARVTAIPYGVDTAHFTPPSPAYRAACRDAFGVAPGTFTACMVAYVYPPKRLTHRGRGIKGHDVLLEAWRRFRRETPGGARLILLGGGFTPAGETHKRALMRRFGVADDPGVDWQDSVLDVRDCYAAADVSISPSLSENHGAALEAGAMGVPSIVSDAGALPETVDPSTGWTVPRDDVDALVAALHEAHAEFRSGVLRRRGQLARARTEARFAQDRAAAAVADVLERVARR